jgi:hypothetical protein
MNTSKQQYFDTKFYNSSDVKQQFNVQVRDTVNFLHDSRKYEVSVVKAQLPLGGVPILKIKASQPMEFHCRDLIGTNVSRVSIHGSFYSVQEWVDTVNDNIKSSLPDYPFLFNLNSANRLEIISTDNAATRKITFNTIVYSLLKHNFDSVMRHWNSDASIYEVTTSSPGVTVATTDSLAQFYQWCSITLYTDLPVQRTSVAFNDYDFPNDYPLAKNSILTTIDINRRAEDSYDQSLIYIPQVERYISMTDGNPVSGFSITARVEYINNESEALTVDPEGFGKIFISFNEK